MDEYTWDDLQSVMALKNAQKPAKTRRKKRAPEGDTQRAIMEYLTLCARVAWFMRANSGGMKINERWVNMAPAGTADIIGMLNDGRFFAIEVKAGNNAPTAAQESFLTLIADNGGVAFVARSVGDVEEVLNGLR